MAYQIDRYNNTLLTTVEDGTIDETTDIKLIGKNYAGYGEIQNENFLYLLENFNGANPPPKALSGQIWFDSSNSKLKFFDGAKFRTTGGAEVSPTQPNGLTEGDFWWDSNNDQLYAYDGSGFVLIGPQNVGEGVTQMVSRNIRDDLGNNRPVILATIDDEVIYISSPTEFTIEDTDGNRIEGFDRVRKGITLKNTEQSTQGVTTDDFYYWGTASNSLRLNGRLSDDYVLKDNANFETVVEFADAGFSVGDSQDLLVDIQNGDEAVFANKVGTVLKFSTKQQVGTSIINSVQITENGMQGGSDNTYNLGQSNIRWANVYATNLKGTADRADKVKVIEGGEYKDAYIEPPQINNPGTVESTIAARDTAGNLRAVLFQGTATTAQYADLAEKYTVENSLPIGTAVAVSTNPDFEVDLAQVVDTVVGVVSENPAYLMNSEIEGDNIALKGRVPVRVLGSVYKGDKVFIDANGICSVNGNGDLVGIALETNTALEEKLVECVLKV